MNIRSYGILVCLAMVQVCVAAESIAIAKAGQQITRAGSQPSTAGPEGTAVRDIKALSGGGKGGAAPAGTITFNLDSLRHDLRSSSSLHFVACSSNWQRQLNLVAFHPFLDWNLLLDRQL
jgi:hypothetical protein